MFIELDIQKDRSENVAYNTPDFPVYVRKGVLSTYPDYSAISHWHDDIELICILSGQMDYNVNGHVITLHENEGIFINNRQFHYGFSPNREECIFICILFHPLLLCSSPYIEHNYIMPVLRNECIPYLHLHPGTTYEAEVLEHTKKIFTIQHSALSSLQTTNLLFQIWENLFQLAGYVEKKNLPVNRHLSTLKDMIRFIYHNYTEKITLKEISQAGKVGKTSCCNIFQKYTNKTPISYLTDYRLKKSIDLLVSTDKTVSEICFDVGFSGASYFTETFRKIYGCTPTEYRTAHLAFTQFDHYNS